MQLELRTASSAEVTDLVRRGEVTLGLRYFLPMAPISSVHAAGAEAMLVVAAAGHPLAGRRVRKVKACAASAGSAFRRYATNAIRQVICSPASSCAPGSTMPTSP